MSSTPFMVYADATGQVYDHPKFLMAVWDGVQVREPREEELIPIPEGSDLYLLPKRLPLGFSGKRKHLVEFDGGTEETLSAVSVFLAPAYVRLAHPAYRTLEEAPVLPLFAYAPVGWMDGRFWTTALRITPEQRQDPGLFSVPEIRKGVDRDLKAFPTNRLMRQLRRCALEYSCRAAQNFYLKRWEAPLPTSPSCNASCQGCISLQTGSVPSTQDRITFTPTPEEIVQVIDLHFSRVKEPVASFGQGCEGEPLMVADTLIKGVQLARQKWKTGTINLNSNASRPEKVKELCEAGLSSIRVSMVSPTPDLYARYHDPHGYDFSDVVASIDFARSMGRFVSLNLLVFPGLTDRLDQVDELIRFVGDHDVNMIQWRNLNLDPEWYVSRMGLGEEVMGLKKAIEAVAAAHPRLKHGYFNPYLG